MDVSTYQPVVWQEVDAEQCDTVFVKQCEDKTEDDFAYLIDFGIARATDETALTSTGAVIGTYHYMAPERLGAGEADARSDIYALACVLFECLTGNRPFPGASVESQVAGHLTAPPPQPSAASPGVPADLDAVIRDGMAKNPDDRFQSTVELARAAREAITVPTSRPAPAVPPVAWNSDASPFAATQPGWVPLPPATTPIPWWRRRKIVIPVAAFSTLAIAAAIIGTTMVLGDNGTAETTPTAGFDMVEVRWSGADLDDLLDTVFALEYVLPAVEIAPQCDGCVCLLVLALCGCLLT